MRLNHDNHVEVEYLIGNAEIVAANPVSGQLRTRIERGKLHILLSVKPVGQGVTHGIHIIPCIFGTDENSHT